MFFSFFLFIFEVSDTYCFCIFCTMHICFEWLRKCEYIERQRISNIVFVFKRSGLPFCGQSQFWFPPSCQDKKGSFPSHIQLTLNPHDKRVKRKCSWDAARYNLGDS
eukprot:971922_1